MRPIALPKQRAYRFAMRLSLVTVLVAASILCAVGCGGTAFSVGAGVTSDAAPDVTPAADVVVTVDAGPARDSFDGAAAMPDTGTVDSGAAPTDGGLEAGEIIPCGASTDCPASAKWCCVMGDGISPSCAAQCPAPTDGGPVAVACDSPQAPCSADGLAGVCCPQDWQSLPYGCEFPWPVDAGQLVCKAGAL